MKVRRFSLTIWLLIGIALTGCEGPKPIPTQASVPMALTADFLTQNAPPPAFQTVQFPTIDRNLDQISNYHYTVSLAFEGTFADSQKEARGEISADVYSNQIIGERRVILNLSGNIFEQASGKVEGVRLGNDFYFVDRNSVCTKATDNINQRQTAELTAGSLIGGIRVANFTTTRQTFNGFDVWQYNFTPGNIILPDIKRTQGDSLTISSGELWVVPKLNVVWQYTLTIAVQNVILDIFQANRQLIGKILVNYKLVEIGQKYNIAIPFGC